MDYKNDNIPLDGLGIQGHTKDYVKPDPTAMWVSTASTCLSATGYMVHLDRGIGLV